MTRVVPQIGLTGSIGSAKSTVAELFRSWGSKILDADDFAKKLLAANSEHSIKLIDRFGPQITRPNGTLDRFALRALVFSDNQAKTELESVLHPEIRKQMLAEGQNLISLNCLSVTYVIPLLFESAFPYTNLTVTITVSADKQICLNRATRRDFCSLELASRIYDSQMPSTERERLADYVIVNNGSIEELTHNAKQIFDRIHSTF